MKNKNITIAIGIVLILIVVGLFLWSVLGIKKTEETRVKTAVVDFSQPMPNFSMESPTEIVWNWQGENNFDEINIFKTKNEALTDSQVSLIKEKSGLVGLIVDKQRRRVEYSVPINNKAEVVVKKRTTVEAIKTIFDNLINTLVVNPGVKIEKINFGKFVYPRWISSEEKEADVVEISANYVFSAKNIYTFEGSPIKAIYDWSGRLLKLEMQLPYEKTAEEKLVKIKSLEEIKKLGVENFKILKVEGGSEYELSGEKELIDTVTITGGEIAYIYSLKNSVLYPFYVLTGNIFLTSGPAKVTLITSAL